MSIKILNTHEPSRLRKPSRFGENQAEVRCGSVRRVCVVWGLRPRREEIGNFSVEIVHSPRRDWKILRTYDFIPPKFHFIPPKFYLAPQ